MVDLATNLLTVGTTTTTTSRNIIIPVIIIIIIPSQPTIRFNLFVSYPILCHHTDTKQCHVHIDSSHFHHYYYRYISFRTVATAFFNKIFCHIRSDPSSYPPRQPQVHSDHHDGIYSLHTYLTRKSIVATNDDPNS